MGLRCSAFENRQTKGKSEACIQLSDSIWMFLNEKISTHGEIYEGELRSNDTRRIVLKLVENISCGETEARILANLNYHKHVLSYIHHGTCHFKLVDQIYIALDKCQLENLRDFVTNRKNNGSAFDLSRAIEIVKQMVDGVKHIHKNRIIHKDIKPDNILFSLDQKLIKIADFGLSREIDSSSAEVFVERQFGTDGFRPPESFGNGIISQKSDIFSLGVTFYFVLSNGEHPFGEDRAVWNHRMMNGEVDLSRLLVPNKIAAEHLIKSMIAHKINQRPTIWQVSEHPFWTGNEVSCNLDYHCPESAVSLISPTSDEPSFDIADVDQHLEHLKNIQQRDEAEAADIRQRTKDSGDNLVAEVQVKLTTEEADIDRSGGVMEQEDGAIYFSKHSFPEDTLIHASTGSGTIDIPEGKIPTTPVLRLYPNTELQGPAAVKLQPWYIPGNSAPVKETENSEWKPHKRSLPTMVGKNDTIELCEHAGYASLSEAVQGSFWIKSYLFFHSGRAQVSNRLIHKCETCERDVVEEMTSSGFERVCSKQPVFEIKIDDEIEVQLDVKDETGRLHFEPAKVAITVDYLTDDYYHDPQDFSFPVDCSGLISFRHTVRQYRGRKVIRSRIHKTDQIVLQHRTKAASHLVTGGTSSVRSTGGDTSITYQSQVDEESD